jgi:putative membrane protein
MSVADLNQLILSSGCFSGASIAGWTVDPAVIVPLGLGGLLYLVGVTRLWRSAGLGRGSSVLQATFFALGWLCMAAALVSPLHDYSRRLFSAHMVEHELVMTVAAPLLVLSRPLGVLLWAFPSRWRRQVANVSQTMGYLFGWDILSRPVIATVLHAAAIWVWHIPGLFDAALANEALHWLQHLSFFATAMFFWWSLLGVRQRAGVAIAELFATGMQTGALGVLLALARQPMYPGQAILARAWVIDPLKDQQLAGLIMWVPAGIVYVAAALIIAGLWIARSSRTRESYVRGT